MGSTKKNTNFSEHPSIISKHTRETETDDNLRIRLLMSMYGEAVVNESGKSQQLTPVLAQLSVCTD